MQKGHVFNVDERPPSSASKGQPRSGHFSIKKGRADGDAGLEAFAQDPDKRSKSPTKQSRQSSHFDDKTPQTSDSELATTLIGGNRPWAVPAPPPSSSSKVPPGTYAGIAAIAGYPGVIPVRPLDGANNTQRLRSDLSQKFRSGRSRTHDLSPPDFLHEMGGQFKRSEQDAQAQGAQVFWKLIIFWKLIQILT